MRSEKESLCSSKRRALDSISGTPDHIKLFHSCKKPGKSISPLKSATVSVAVRTRLKYVVSQRRFIGTRSTYSKLPYKKVTSAMFGLMHQTSLERSGYRSMSCALGLTHCAPLPRLLFANDLKT